MCSLVFLFAALLVLQQLQCSIAGKEDWAESTMSFLDDHKLKRESEITDRLTTFKAVIGLSKNPLRFKNPDARIDELVEAGYAVTNSWRRVDMAEQLWFDLLDILVFNQRKTNDAVQAKQDGTLHSIKIGNDKKYYLEDDKSSIAYVHFALYILYSMQQPSNEKKATKHLNLVAKFDDCNYEGLVTRSDRYLREGKTREALKMMDKAILCEGNGTTNCV